MQKQILILKEETAFKIQANLDVENSVFLTKLLFEYVEQNKITFELSSKRGSIISEFIVNVIGGLFSSVLYNLAKRIYDKLREDKLKGKKISPVYIFLPDRQYVLTGENTDVLPDG
jgi:hypothetical protein